jgi:hypothetical protein
MLLRQKPLSYSYLPTYAIEDKAETGFEARPHHRVRLPSREASNEVWTGTDKQPT